MFRIGEFSRIAQVSGRLLRYYDQIGLLTPEHTDPETGYRYYSARQLPRLNRILALKELGLTLEQIGRLVDGEISQEEIRGMLMMKKAQIEQTLHEEFNRFRYIESRIKQIDAEGEMQNYDIVVKSVPAMPYLSFRELCAGFQAGRAMLQDLMGLLPEYVEPSRLGHFTAIAHGEGFMDTDIDLEMGFLLNEPAEISIPLPDGHTMTTRELPAVHEMLTVVRVGNSIEGHGSYSSLGIWVETNGYVFDGKVREVFLEPPLPGRESEAVAEIQFPIKKVSNSSNFLTIS